MQSNTNQPQSKEQAGQLPIMETITHQIKLSSIQDTHPPSASSTSIKQDQQHVEKHNQKHQPDQHQPKQYQINPANIQQQVPQIDFENIIVQDSNYDKQQPKQTDQIQQTSIAEEKQANRADQFAALLKLQDLLKDEYFLLTTEQQQKGAFQKKLSTAILNHYRNAVHFGDDKSISSKLIPDKMQSSFKEGSFLSNSSPNPNPIHRHPSKSLQATIIKSQTDRKSQVKIDYATDRRLFDDEGFGNCYTYIKQVLLILSKQPMLMLLLLQRLQSQSGYQLGEIHRQLIRSLMHSFYQNIVDGDMYCKDVLILLKWAVKHMISNSGQHCGMLQCRQGLAGMMLCEYLTRPQIRAYGKAVARNTLLQIAKLDHVIQYRAADAEQERIKSPAMLKIQSSKSTQSPLKASHYSATTNTNQTNSKIRSYADGLRQFDEKTKRSSRRRNKNCVSQDLMKHLGISQQIQFPSFVGSALDELHRKQYQLDVKLTSIISNQPLTNHHQLYNIPDIGLLKNLILTLFNDLFRTLYSMPLSLRVAAEMIAEQASRKWKTPVGVKVVGIWLVEEWLGSVMGGNLTQSKLYEGFSKNVQQVMKIMRGVIRNDYSQVHPAFSYQFSTLLSNLRSSIHNYLTQLLNIPHIEIPLQSSYSYSLASPNKIRSYCVCISVAQVGLLTTLCRISKKELEGKGQLGERLSKRSKKIDQMSDGEDLFGDRKDKVSNKVYRSSQAYVLFSQLTLPPNLELDYSKHYMSAFKSSKPKSLLKQLLLSLPSLTTLPTFYSAATLELFFSSLSLSLTEDDSLHTTDTIPLTVKLRYLGKVGKELGKAVNQMEGQCRKRGQLYRSVWSKTKQCYLEAVASIYQQSQKLVAKEIKIKEEVRKRKMDEFIHKTKIAVCLTSPKSRASQLVLKTTLMKDLAQSDKSQLWLQAQAHCIHNALNLQFIKSLTGQPQSTKSNSKNDAHISHISKFADVLCSLPQVKESASERDDIVGVRDVVRQFVRYCGEIAEKDGLGEDKAWFEEYLQQKISKRFYQKLYPKMPTYDDIALYLRLKTLNFLTFNHLKIPAFLHIWPLFQIAASQLRLMDKLKTAGEKLNCIVQASKMIINSYRLMSDGDGAVGADDVYPIVVMVVVRAAPKRLLSNIHFIETFATQSKLLSKEGYFFTQLKSVVQFLDTLTADGLSMGDSSQYRNHIQFCKKIYQKEIEYGIYFLLGRRKDDPITEKKKLEGLRKYLKERESNQIQKKEEQNCKQNKKISQFKLQPQN